MKKMKSIAVDMDGVLADIEAQFLNFYEKETGERLSRDIFHGVLENDALPNGSGWKFVHSAGFFRSAPLMEGAVTAVKTLQEHFEVYIVSAAMEFPQSLPEKKEWLNEHFPFVDWKHIVFCGDKSIISTDYLIDDHCKNLDYCKGTPILFTAGHNVHIDKHTRANNWNEVLNLLMGEEA